jgi:prepilin-type N-terminal cleavage/methylation domain-containing protein
MSARRGRPGFTLLEMAATLGILGFVAVGVTRALIDVRKTSADSLHRTFAHAIARNEIERLRGLGPEWHETASDTARVNEWGDETPMGLYTRAVVAEVRCEGGPLGEENPAAAVRIPHECEEQRPVIVYRVSVAHPSRSGYVQVTPVQYELRLGAAARYGDVEMRQRLP